MRVEHPRPNRSESVTVCSCCVLLTALLGLAAPTGAQPAPVEPLAFTTLAGLPAGSEDGPKAQARLSYPFGVAVDGGGNVYVSDQFNHKIRRVAPDGSVTTVAGSGTASADDGPGARAMFAYPAGVARDAAGNLYVADQWNNTIRKVTPGGLVTKLSGFYGGFQDGPASLARYSNPTGVAVDGAGNVYVADSGNNRIRKVAPDGSAATIAGDGTYGFADGPASTARFRNPRGVAVDGAGVVYVADRDNNRIRTIAPDGTVATLAGNGSWGFADGPAGDAQFAGPVAVALNGSGTVVVGDEGNNRIRLVAGGIVSTLAGDGGWGYLDGPGATAQFRNPNGVAVDGSGNVLVADSFNNRIRSVAPDGTVTTLTGNGTSSYGFADEPGTQARMGFPMNLAVGSTGDVYFPDQNFNRIRKVGPDGAVNTVSGSGNWGWVDGAASVAEFRNPYGIAFEADGSIVVADTGNNVVRRVATDGSVTTIAGDGNWGWVDGPAGTARFAGPAAAAVDASGNVYVGEWGNHAIRKIAPDGTVSTLAGSGQPGYVDGPGTTARFNDPNGLVLGADGALYATDQWNAVIRRIALDGTVSTFAGAGWGFADGPGAVARFRCPYGLTTDGLGNLYVADQWNHRIRKVTPGGEVSTIGGSGAAGGLDGTGASAQFSLPAGVAVGADGALYVMDTNNNAVRVGRTASVLDSATIDAAFGTVGAHRQLGTSPLTATSWTWLQTGVPPGSTATLSTTSSPSPTFTPDVAGGYGFRLTATASGGATGVSEVRLVAWVPPTATVSGGGTICAGMAATVQAALTGVPPWSLTWSDGLVQTGIATSPVVRVVYPAATTAYSVTAVSDFNGAGTAGGGATVTVSGVAPSAAIAAPGLALPGQSVPASVPDAGVGATYAWTASGGTITSATNVRAITFETGPTPFVVLGVTVTTPGGCLSDGTWTVRVAPEVSAPLAYTTLAGQTAGNEDGPGTQARFAFGPQSGLAVDSAGNVYVGDAKNHLVRRVSPAGVVSTLSGSGVNGYLDGPGHVAQFGNPKGVALDPAGNLFVAEEWNNLIRKVAPDGTVSTFAGSGHGYLDGPGLVAQFSRPTSLARDAAGNLYVGDAGNNRIRKIAPDGFVSTLAGDGTSGFVNGEGTVAQFRNPDGVALDASGNVYVADQGNNSIRKVTPAGVVSTLAGTGIGGMFDGPGTAAQFGSPRGVAVDAGGNVYVADEWNNRIRRVTPSGDVTTFSGNGNWGYVDGTATVAEFRQPVGVAFDASGVLYVTDMNNLRIRKLASDGTTSTLTGSGPGPWNGHAEGTGSSAVFSSPSGVAIDASGNAFVADQWNNRIRKVTPAGVVTTFAGDGNPGSEDGPGTLARFNGPMDVAMDALGNLYVSDVNNNRIRKVAPDATVTTLAGTGAPGWADGPGSEAELSYPMGLALDGTGSLLVADHVNHRIRKIAPDGSVTTIAGTGAPGLSGDGGPALVAQLNYPQAVAVDAMGNVLVADTNNGRIRKIATDGTMGTFANGCFVALAFDGSGQLFASDCGGQIRTIAPDGTVGTVGGDGVWGGNDGLGTFARLRNPRGLAVRGDGELVVADQGNTAIRVARTAVLTDEATIDATSGPMGQTRQLGTTGPVATTWSWRIVRQPPGSTAALSSTSVRTPTFTAAVPGFYRFRLTAGNGGGVESITETSLLAYVPATATVSGGGAICAGMPATVEAALTGAPPWSLTWSDGVVQPGVLSSPLVRTVTPSSSWIYSLTALADANGPGNPSGSAVVSVSGTAPSAVITAPGWATPGQAGLTASVPDAGVGATYAWIANGGTITSATNTRTITFTAGSATFVVLTVTVTKAAGCFMTGSWTLRVAPSLAGPLAFTTLAGETAGNEDGPGSEARFALGWQAGLAVDASGNVYVGDMQNNRIRKVSAGGEVSTLAGTGEGGLLDGPGHLAQLGNPVGVVLDPAGNLYVAASNAIRKVAPDGTVSTFSGSGQHGDLDGPGTVAQFRNPTGLARDAAGNLYVSDSNNQRIRKIAPDGSVSTLAGSGAAGFVDGAGTTAQFNNPQGLAVDAAGYVYVADLENHAIRKVSPAGAVTTLAGTGANGMYDGPGTMAQFGHPVDVDVDSAGNVFVAEEWNNRIRKVAPDGFVTTFSGSGNWGYLDGAATVAEFRSPAGISFDSTGTLYVTEGGNLRIRKVAPDGSVTTFVGSGPDAWVSWADGTGSAARFTYPGGLGLDAQGNAFVADQHSHRIRKVTPGGVVTTFAGSGGYGWVDGPGTTAQFAAPQDAVVDAAGNVYVADSNNHRIRKVAPDATVTTLAGTGVPGWADGPGSAAQFDYPMALALDGAGALLVADHVNHRIRKVAPDGSVTTIAGTGAPGFSGDGGPATQAQFNYPQGVAVDGAGRVLVADSNNGRVRRIANDGTISTFANVCLVSLALDGSGTLYGSECGNRIQKVAPDGTVSTLAGDGATGGSDGLGTFARFRGPTGLAVSADGTLLVVDRNNHSIRIGRPATLTTAATIDAATGPVVASRQLGTTGPAATTWEWRVVQRPFGSTASFSSPSIQAPTFQPDAPGFYRFRLTAGDGGGAESTTETSLLAYTPATATVIGGGAICAGMPTTVEAWLTGAPPWSVTWNDGFVQAGVVSSPLVRTVTPSSDWTYSVTALSDANGAGTASGSAAVTVSGTAPSATITAPGWATPGQAGLTASVPDAGAGATFAWSATGGTITSAANGRTITFTAGSATFVVLTATVTKSAGCWVTGSWTVRVAPDLAVPLTFTTLAATTAGNEDGPASQARFAFGWQTGLAIDASGNVYVGDAQNHRIRKVSPSGEVSTLAGTGANGYLDGQGHLAQFGNPSGVALGPSGKLYVAESWNNRIREVAPDGTVSTFAGSGMHGFADGPATVARFRNPGGVARDASGNLYVADRNNNRIRKVAPDGTVSTLAGDGNVGFVNGAGTLAQFRNPEGVAVDASGNVYVADNGNHSIRKVTPAGVVSTLAGTGFNGMLDGPGTTAQFGSPRGVAVDSSGNVFVADEWNNLVRRITPAGFVTTFSGNGNWGYADGTASAAGFRNPVGVAFDAAGFLYVIDANNLRVRKLTSDGTASTLAGSGPGPWNGYVDGTGSGAVFNSPAGVGVDSSGNVFVADQNTNRIRKVTSAGVVTTFAGTGNGGFQDGPGTSARFWVPVAVVVDAAGNVYVSDSENQRIRKIAPDASVTTLAGKGVPGWADGAGSVAQFHYPAGLALDGAGNIYVADSNNHRVRKVSPDGTVTTVAGSGTPGYVDGPASSAQLNNPWGVAVDAAGNVYIADCWNSRIRKLSGGQVSTFSGSCCGAPVDGPATSARFDNPQALALDGAGNLFVSEWGGLVRRVAPDGSVTTVGSDGIWGGNDGLGTFARFRQPQGLAVGPDGTLFVADQGNDAIRIGRAATLTDTATIDAVTAPVGQTRQLGTTGPVATSWAWRIVQRPFGSTAALSSPSVREPTFVPVVPGRYRFRLTATGGGAAQSITETTLFAYVSATATVTGGGAICAGMPSTVQAALTGAPPWSLTWSDGLVQTGITSSPVVRTVSPGVTTSYSVTAVSDANGAGTFAGDATVAVSGTAPSAVIAAPGSAAPGQSGLVASVPDAGAGGTYAWVIANGTITSPANLPTITFAAGTEGFVVLTVTVTIPGGCVSTGTWSLRAEQAPATALTFTTLAGVPTGNEDGPAASARFTLWDPGLAQDAAGNVYLADSGNNTIRRIAPDGSVTTLAGSGQNGFQDGPASLASFANPAGVAVGASGDVYVADQYNNRIRKVATDGTVSTVAGSGSSGYLDGPGTTARFNRPVSVAIDGAGVLYVADFFNHRIRKVAPDGTVSTLAGDGTAGFADGDGTAARFNGPRSIAVDSAGTAYVADSNNHRIRSVAPNGAVTTLAGTGSNGWADGPGTSAQFNFPRGVAVDAAGNLYVADSNNQRLRRVDAAGNVSTLAGGGYGYVDGPSSTARFANPMAVTVDASGVVVVADGNNQRLRKVTPAGVVSTFSGSGQTPTAGWADGAGSAALFSSPSGVAIDGSGDIYVGDYWNNVIRKVTPAGVVTTFAGSGSNGYQDGPAGTAQFWSPMGVTLNGSGPLLVADQRNHRIRTVAPDGSVGTLAGSGEAGFQDGLGADAKFSNPAGLAVDGAGNAYVADRDNHRIRKVAPGGTVTTLAGTGTSGWVDGVASGAQFRSPLGVAVDGSGTVYVADQNNNRIRKIANGMVTTLAGSGSWGSVDGPGTMASFRSPSGVVVDRAGNVYVAEANGVRIRRVAPDGTVSTVGGNGVFGGNDGVGTSAKFRGPQAVAVAFDGTLVVADSSNNAIRVGRPVALAVAATIDSPTGVLGQVRQLGTTGAGATEWSWSVTRRPVGSTASPSEQSISAPTFTPDAKGLYTIRLAAANAGAQAITEVQLYSAPAPTATVSGDATICVGHGTVIQAALTGTPPWSITWSDDFVQTGLTASPATRIVSPTTATTYTVSVVTDAIGSGSSSGSAVISLSGVAPSATVTAPATALPGQAGLTASVPDAGVGATYLWSVTNGTITVGDGTPTITFSVPSAGWTAIRVTVTKGGCSSDGLANVWVGVPVTGPLTFTVHAGSPTGSGWFDGTGAAAKFNYPYGIVADGAGNVFVGDTGSHEIRRVSASGVVTTFAGSGRPGQADGPGALATLSSPRGLARDAAGNLYVADYGNRRIRKVTPSGVVTTIAGSGESGSADGPSSIATFSYPGGVAVDAAGNVYVADTYNYKIRKVTPSGVVSTLAGSGAYGFADGPGTTAAFRTIWGLAADASGTVYVADTNNNRIRRIAPDGVVSTLAGTGSSGSADGPGTQATFRSPYGVAVDATGAVYVADRGNNKVRLVTAAGFVSTFAGSGTAGSADGTGTAASFYAPGGVTVDAAGDVFVADNQNSLVRRITPAGVVTTLAGSVAAIGAADGVGTAASFWFPYGGAIDGAGNVYVADSSNNKIRKVAPTGEVSTLAGTGTYGSQDGPATTATFRFPTGVAVDVAGNLYVVESNAHKIRKITPAGVVSTLAGSGTAGSQDGPGPTATFNYPWHLAVDGAGNVYVADESNHKIRKVAPDGFVTTLAGTGAFGSQDGPGSQATFYYPAGVAVDAAGIVFVADLSNGKIRKIAVDGTVTTLAGTGEVGNADGPGTAASFNGPIGLDVDGQGGLYVADRGNSTVRHVTSAGVVTTVAGDTGRGTADGTARDAQFGSLASAHAGFDGNIYVVDTSGSVRVGRTGLSDRATVDLPGGPVGQARQLDVTPQTATSWAWEIVRRPPGSTAALSASGIRNPTFTPDAPGLYTFRVTATDGSGKKGITTVSSVACAMPETPVAANDGPACAGGTIQLSAPYVPGATYSWTGPNGYSSSEMLPTLSNVTVAMAGTYSVRIRVGPGDCESPAGATEVVVHARPTLPVITAPATVVPNATFNASVEPHAGSAWAWTVLGGTIVGGQGTSQVVVKATWASVVTLKVVETNASGCSSAEATENVAVALPEGSAAFYTLTPCRVVNTRRTDYPAGLGAPSIGPAGSPDRTLPLTSGACGIPATARAVALNITVADTQGAGYLTLYPGDGMAPATSTINFAAGQVKANNLFLPLATNGSGTIKVKSGATGPLNVLIDVVGYFE